MKKRLEHIDILKGLAIFLMVMGHVLSWNALDSGTPRTVDSWFIREVIYSFHMPLFIFMSGYVIDLKAEKWGGQRCERTIQSRLRSLVLPCISWKTVGLVCSVISTGAFVINYEVPWFLRTLFEISLLFVLVKGCCCRFNISLNLEILLYCIVYIFIFIGSRIFKQTIVDTIVNFTSLHIMYPYFILGYLFHKKESLFQRNCLFTLSVIIYIISFYYYQYIETSATIHAILRYIMSSSAIYTIYTLFKCYTSKDGIIFNWCNIMGKHSIEIYLLSSFFTPRFPEVSRFIYNLSLRSNEYLASSIFIQVVLGVSLSAYCVVCCMLASKIICKSKYGAYLMFGKK